MNLLQKLTATFLITIVFITNAFSIHSNHIGNDYKVNEDGKITLVKRTKDNFDRLIAVSTKKEKILYTPKGNPVQDYLEVEKGFLKEGKAMHAHYKGKHLKGLRIEFGDNFEQAQAVFDFLADHSYVEWSLLSFGTESASRTNLYTTYQRDLEFFGALKTHRLVHAPNIISIKHYHNHPRYDIETEGKYAFPSDQDLDFRNYVLKYSMQVTEFKIRTDGIYIDYSSPLEWNKANNEL